MSVKKKETADKKDDQSIGFFKEMLTVVFSLQPEQVERIMNVVNSSKDKLNIKTYTVRDKIGTKALKTLRIGVEYARHEGSVKHEDDTDEFEITKNYHIDAFKQSNDNPFDKPYTDEEDMKKPIKECTFKDYLLEFEVDGAMTPQEQMRAVQMHNKNPMRSDKENLKDNINKTREVQKDPNATNKSEKLRLLNLKKQAAVQQQKLDAKEKNSEQEMGIQGDTGERPGTGMM